MFYFIAYINYEKKFRKRYLQISQPKSKNFKTK